MDYLNHHPSNPINVQHSPEAPILDIRNLSTEFHTEYGVVKAVNGVSFILAKGETMGIVGESGSGKTVTMLSVMQLVDIPPGRIAGGEVLFEGTDLLELAGDKIRDIRGGKIAMVFQDPLTSLNPVFTIGEQLIEPLKVHLGLSGKSAREHARESLAQVGIPNTRQALDYYPHQFSGGMRQRAMIAMAISCNPSLLIADEPTTALDVTVQEQILDLVENLRKKLGMSIVWITHDLGVIAGLADRVIVMYAGEIVECSPTPVLFENPRHPYTLGLLQSIPRVDIPRSEKLKPILGNPPDLVHLRMGCHFVPRCQYRITKCFSEHPELVEVTPDHTSRCWVQPESPVLFS
jgi:oligopeptide transport system ATP-binding protein